jgi:hypothetical protein
MKRNNDNNERVALEHLHIHMYIYRQQKLDAEAESMAESKETYYRGIRDLIY